MALFHVVTILNINLAGYRPLPCAGMVQDQRNRVRRHLQFGHPCCRRPSQIMNPEIIKADGSLSPRHRLPRLLQRQFGVGTETDRPALAVGAAGRFPKPATNSA
jgi:hypothetical protein